MAQFDTNLAYNISQYEAREERERSRSKENIKVRPAKEVSQTPAAVGTVLFVIAVGALLFATVSSKADIATVHADIVAQEAVVQSLRQDNSRMKMELEQKSSQKAVETYAEDVLGMQKMDKSQIEYVSLESGNKVEISDSNSNIFTDIKNAADKFMEYLKG